MLNEQPKRKIQGPGLITEHDDVYEERRRERNRRIGVISEGDETLEEPQREFGKPYSMPSPYRASAALGIDEPGVGEVADNYLDSGGVSAPVQLELENKKFRHQKGVIGFAEGLFVTMGALAGDVLEVIVPIVGLIFGLMASGGLILWSLMRGVHSRWAIRVVLLHFFGAIVDFFTFGGIAPIRTIVLLIAIFLNNHAEKKSVRVLSAAIEALAKTVKA